ncbi:MAG: prepilin-type N-terminal cleavage/methylation domain-containing protein [Verrucomicrobiales bacterium]|nr:prepilin-type N-terminal cleavage/methylation domain-containing protein [Verrucomicrobiales bacterium]
MNSNSISVRSHRQLGCRRGFTLIELLCVVAVIGLMTSLSIFSVNSIAAGKQLANNAYELAGVIRMARTAAIAQNTYVGIGFYKASQGNQDVLMVATIVSKTGQLSDLQDSNRYQLLSKCAVLKNVQFDEQENYLNLSGIDEANNVDVLQSQRMVQANIGGGQSENFSNVIVINPSGAISMMNSGGSDELTRCVGIGLKASPSSASKVRLAAVQVTGLSGQISVFLQ